MTRKSWWSKFLAWLSGPDEDSAPQTGGAPLFAARSSGVFSPHVVRIRYGVYSTVGNHREHNEDNFYVPGRGTPNNSGIGNAGGESTSSRADSSNEPFIVADGMGGQQAGEEASRMAVEIIPKALARRLVPDDVDPKGVQGAVREAFAEANQEILGSSGTVTEYSNMGTTVVLALFRENQAYVAGIGDSRAYRLRDGRLEQLTTDHSLADALGAAGTISKEEVPHHKYKNVLYLYLGCKDARSGPEEVRVLDVKPGDRFLLATDGLTGVVHDNDLTRILETASDPQQGARALVELALANDSKDNVTAMVIHVLPAPVPASEVGT